MHKHLVALILLAAAATSSVGQSEIVWNNPWNTNATQIGPSSDSPESWGEVADDFDAVASIDRIIARGDGAGCFSCDPPATLGVFVRFYEWTDAGPGALQREYFIDADDPTFLYDPAYPSDLDIRLPEPFGATGRHFVSVQMLFGDTPWTWDLWVFWPSNLNNPTLSPAFKRSSAGANWNTSINSDVAFTLFGVPPDGSAPSDDPCGEWQLELTPDPAGAIYSKLSDIAYVSPTEVWAVGVFGSNISQWTIQETLALRWDGSDWNHVPTPNPTACPQCTHASFTSVAVAGPNDIWAAGNAVVQIPPTFIVGARIMVQHWDGSSWSVVPTPEPGGGAGSSLADIEVLAPDEIWFVGSDGPYPIAPSPALTLRWNGSHFERFDVPIVNPEVGRDAGNPLNAVDAIAPDDMWAVGATDVTADGAHDYSQIHHWDGSEWNHVPGPTPGYANFLFAVEAVATDDVWAAGEYWDVDGIFPFLIHWDGNSWTQVDAPNIFFDFHAFGPDDIYASSGGIYHYDGTSWELVDAIPEALFPRLAGLDAAEPCELWAAGLEDSADLRSLAVRHTPGTECPADLNGDDVLNFFDIQLYLEDFASDNPDADVNSDGAHNFFDVQSFLSEFAAGCT